MIKLILSISILMSTIFNIREHEKLEVEQLRSYTNFEIYVPSGLGKNTNYEIKIPSDLSEMQYTDLVLINYFNSIGSYIFGIRQQKITPT